jgi:hypothetical protein
MTLNCLPTYLLIRYFPGENCIADLYFSNAPKRYIGGAMKGLGKALNRLATSEASRAYATATKKEECRMADTFEGCKHNPARNRVASQALVDIAIPNYVPETEEEIIDLMGLLYTPTEIGIELADGMFLMPDGDYYVVELKAQGHIQLDI